MGGIMSIESYYIDVFHFVICWVGCAIFWISIIVICFGVYCRKKNYLG